MIPKVTRGDRPDNLALYLVGPGKRNEHTNPHLVAGDDLMMSWHGDRELTRADAVAIAKYIDAPHDRFGTQVAGGHIWHASLSLAAEDGQLDEAQWQQIAEDFVTGMGFVDPAGVKAPCRWVAVHHGASVAGNDHIHVMVSVVREDGTKANLSHDYRRAQNTARVLEREHDLRPLRPNVYELARAAARAQWETHRREHGTMPWAELTPELQEQQVRAQFDTVEAWEFASATRHQPGAATWSTRDHGQHRTSLDQRALAARVRGCAAAAADEAEFVRRLRRAGLMVRPYYVKGTRDQVAGYSLALRPAAGERASWWSPSKQLGADLSLPKLREAHGWDDAPGGRQAAVAEWNAARGNTRPVGTGADTAERLDDAAAHRCAQELGALVDRLRQVPVHDRGTWAAVARAGAGVLSHWSMRAEPDGQGPLSRAAWQLSKSAQERGTGRPVQLRSVLGDSAGALFMLAAISDGAAGQAAVVAQLLRLTRAVMDANAAAQDARLARDLRAVTERDLRAVHERLAAADAVAAKMQAQVPPAPERVTGAPLTPEQERIRDQIRSGGADKPDAELAELLRRTRAAFPTAAGSTTPPAPGQTDIQPRAPGGGRGRDPDRGRGQD